MKSKHWKVLLIVAGMQFLAGCAKPGGGLGGGLAGALPGAGLLQGGENGVDDPAGATAGAPSNAPLSDKLDASFLPTRKPAGHFVIPAADGPGSAGSDPSGGGTAANNVLAMANDGTLNHQEKANDGRLTFTQYGGPTDGTPDSYTASGFGNRGNKLRSSSLALSPNLIREYGLKGGEPISVRANGQTRYIGTYDDTTGNRKENNVIDVYDPTDSMGRDSFMRSIPKDEWELVPGERGAPPS